MGFRKTFSVVLIAGLLALLFGACPSPDPAASDKVINHNLITIFDFAKKHADTGTVSLKSEDLQNWFARGWSTVIEGEDNEPENIIAAVNKSALFKLNVLNVSDRWISFTAALAGDLGSISSQQIEIKYNAEILETITLSDQEFATYKVFIPARIQREGINRLIFRFKNFARNQEFAQSNRRARWREGYPGVALYLSDITVSLGNKDGLKTNKLRNADEYFRVTSPEARLIQRCDSRFEYGFEIRKGAKLKLSGTFSGANADTTLLKILANTDAADPEILWNYSPDERAGNEFEQVIDLNAYAGKMVLFGFEARSSQPNADSIVMWETLELVSPPDQEENTLQNESNNRKETSIENVVIICLDALRFDAVKIFGAEESLMPNLNEFVNEALVFSNAIAPAPYTIASVSSLFSGYYPEAHGVRHGRNTYPEELHNLARTFKTNGWFTLNLAGTQFVTKKYGITRDFDIEYYLRPEEDKTEEISTMDLSLVAKGLDTVVEQKSPAFIYMHLLPPHWPYRPPAPYDNIYIDSSNVDKTYLKKIRSFRGDADHPLVKELYLHYKNNVVYADAIAGEIISMLKERDLYENSLILITSDHGEAFAEHGALEHGNTVFEEMIKVPFVLKIPGVEHRVIATQVSWMDIYPTLIKLLELQEENINFDGIDLKEIIYSPDKIDRDNFYSRAFGEKLKFTLRNNNFKYIYNDGVDLLFDLSKDHEEKSNLAAELPARTATMRLHGLMLSAANAMKNSNTASEVELSSEEEEELKNLGYLQ